ncbi:hypothetical protein Tco_0053261 [Tanacetum coccineum]
MLLTLEEYVQTPLGWKDGQSIDVDAPPDIIDVVDEDDDIIDEEDPIPHDLADSDDEDLVNLDIDDGVNVVYSNVSGCCTGHGGDGGGDDRPLHTRYPPVVGVAWATEGTRKPNLGGRRAGRQHTRQETRNLGLKAITDKSGPVTIRFEFGDRDTLMPLGEHATHWANYLGEIVREMPLHYPSWRQVPPEQKAGVMAQIGYDMASPHGIRIAGHLSIGHPAALQKFTMARRTAPKKGIDWAISWNDPRTVPGLPKINKTGQRARSYADRDPASVAQSPGVGRVLPRQGTVIPPPPPCTHSSDVVKLKKREKVLTRQVNMFMKLFRSDDKFSQMLTQLESQHKPRKLVAVWECAAPDDDRDMMRHDVETGSNEDDS